MKQRIKISIFISLPLIGLLAGYLLMGRTVQAVVDGEKLEIRTRVLTVGAALRSAGVSLDEGDQVIPPVDTWLSQVDEIQVNSVRLVRVLVEPAGDLLEVQTALLTPAEILALAGLVPEADDRVSVEGVDIALEAPLAYNGEVVLQYHPAVTLTLTLGGDEQSFTTTAPNLAEALWEAGILLRAGDSVSPSIDTLLTTDLEVEVKRGRELEITADGETFTGYSAAETIGAALADNGVSLQDLDYSLPALSDALPADGIIRVVRVTEELIMQQSTIPYESELQADDTMEIGTREVIEPGAVGISADRVLVRYEDGEEVSRVNEGSMVIAEPLMRVVHYGTKIVDKVMDTPDGPITYYMAVNVVATSYSPCRSGVPGKCYPGTSYGLPVQKGVIGVHRSWYYMFAGSQIYVPGYGVGTIADIGYYPYSDYWIDLGYSDADYVSWGSTNVTIYFLSPAPPGFSGVLP
ncbi:MAG: ubiquitin-like domain-containing protein [Anaerolineaceae bacterium]|jgi:uncharacterized protein YabE (DUF348 family)